MGIYTFCDECDRDPEWESENALVKYLLHMTEGIYLLGISSEEALEELLSSKVISMEGALMDRITCINLSGRQRE